MKITVNCSNRIEAAVNQIFAENSRYQKGFTLLEIMAAVSIIAIVLVSVYKLHAQTVSMNNEVIFYTTAPMLAQLKMAEVESEKLEDLGDESGDFGDEFPDYRFEIIIDDVESESLGNLAKRMKRIDLRISFNNDEFVYNLRGYKYFKD